MTGSKGEMIRNDDRKAGMKKKEVCPNESNERGKKEFQIEMSQNFPPFVYHEKIAKFTQ